MKTNFLKILVLAAILASTYAIGHYRGERDASVRWVQITSTILHNVDDETEETDGCATEQGQ